VIWLNPAALFALALASAPILIHLLVQRRAERLAFPTLRFLRPTRLAAIRRHVLEDIPLLLVRAAILAAAVAALAGPLLVTSARRRAWDERLVREVVSSDDLPDGIRRAVASLEKAPPARREIVIVSPLAVGSITSADVAAIPADIGIRFERRGELPPSRTVPFGAILTTSGEVDRQVTLAGPQTMVRDTAIAPASSSVWTIEVVASPDARPAVDAALAAVRTQRVRASMPDRRARLILVSQPVAQPFRAATSDAGPVRTPWIADAIARLARDADLQTAAARVPRGIAEPSFSVAPWQPVAAAADGALLVAAAAAQDRLIVASGAPASDFVTPLVMRAIANALAPVPDVRGAEVVPIGDAVLRAWTREPSAPATPRLNSVDEDDRRWLWIAALILLAAETWLRRRTHEQSAVAVAGGETPAALGGTSRVA